MKNWLVVANASRARVLEASDRGGAYIHVADLVHPGSRQKGTELGGDRPGHVSGPGPGGIGSAALDSRTDPREREHDHFAREVAALLDQGVAAGRCAGLVLVASNPFLGHLKQHLGGQAQKLVLRTVAADYTALNERELAQRLAADGGE
ncbi:MAG: host attachment protein [Burkholderiaceae bacterium]|nr:host attachment protein [Burkholderiaceae bacterium]